MEELDGGHGNWVEMEDDANVVPKAGSIRVLRRTRLLVSSYGTFYSQCLTSTSLFILWQPFGSTVS